MKNAQVPIYLPETASKILESRHTFGLAVIPDSCGVFYELRHVADLSPREFSTANPVSHSPKEHIGRIGGFFQLRESAVLLLQVLKRYACFAHWSSPLCLNARVEKPMRPLH
jgi:hypothetical protein